MGIDLSRRLRRLALGVSLTPLHPQWFTFRSKRRAAETATRSASGLLLDVGCGEGALASMLPDTARYVGVDHPGTSQGRYASRPNVMADAAVLPFADECVDVVALLDVLEHVENPRAVVAEAARVLRAGGRLHVHVPFLYPLHDEPYDFVRPTRHWLDSIIRQAGLEVISLEARGQPLETCGLLFNVALAQIIRRAIDRFPPAVLLAAFGLPVFLLVNLAAWSAGALLPRDQSMPFAYALVAMRVDAAVESVSK